MLSLCNSLQILRSWTLLLLIPLLYSSSPCGILSEPHFSFPIHKQIYTYISISYNMWLDKDIMGDYNWIYVSTWSQMDWKENDTEDASSLLDIPCYLHGSLRSSCPIWFAPLDPFSYTTSSHLNSLDQRIQTFLWKDCPSLCQECHDSPAACMQANNQNYLI